MHTAMTKKEAFHQWSQMPISAQFGAPDFARRADERPDLICIGGDAVAFATIRIGYSRPVQVSAFERASMHWRSLV